MSAIDNLDADGFQISSGSRWYVAYTKPKLELVAQSNLAQQGFEAYLPLFKKFKKTEQGPVALFEPMWLYAV